MIVAKSVLERLLRPNAFPYKLRLKIQNLNLLECHRITIQTHFDRLLTFVFILKIIEALFAVAIEAELTVGKAITIQL